MKKLNIYYDEEGDYLELNIGKITDGYFKNMGDGIFERIDNKTGNVTGVAIHCFKKRSTGRKPFEMSLPAEFFQAISKKSRLRT